MTPKEAVEMLNKCGTNAEQPYEDMILEALEQALTELEELKEFISDIFTDKELNQWLFDNRINMWVYIKNKNEVKE